MRLHTWWTHRHVSRHRSECVVDFTRVLGPARGFQYKQLINVYSMSSIQVPWTSFSSPLLLASHPQYSSLFPPTPSAVLCGMWDLSSLTRDLTHVPCVGSAVLTTRPTGTSLHYFFSLKEQLLLSFLISSSALDIASHVSSLTDTLC